VCNRLRDYLRNNKNLRKAILSRIKNNAELQEILKSEIRSFLKNI
jgi:hypothetical protein